MQIKKIVFLLCFSGWITTNHAQVVEWSNIKNVTLGAPFHGQTNGFQNYTANNTKRSTAIKWKSMPYIGFTADDNLGTDPVTDYCPVRSKTPPKHLGADYFAPGETNSSSKYMNSAKKVVLASADGIRNQSGTPVYAIADGYIRRTSHFSVGSPSADAYVVVESGNNDKWTTLYGHLVFTTTNLNSYIKIKKGDYIGKTTFFHDFGDSSHLHLAIRKGAYIVTTPNPAVTGFECSYDKRYIGPPKYDNFIDPQTLNFETYYY